MAPPPAKSNDSGGFWPGLLGGLMGGAAVALAASLFWFDGDRTVSTVEFQSIEDRLLAAENGVSELGQLADRATSDDELAGRLADLEQQLTALNAGSGGASQNTEGLSGSPADGTGFDERLSNAEQELSKLSEMFNQSSDAQRSASETLAALQGALSTVEASLSATGSATESNSQQVTALDGSVKALSDRLGQSESKLDFIGGEYQRGAALVVAIGDIDRSINRAQPFDEAINSLRLLGNDSSEVTEAVAILEPMAKDGVPTLADLRASFGSVSSRILLAGEGSGTLADQVSDNLFSIMNMRPAGAEVEGDDSRAIVARAQAKLSAGDLEAVVAELGGLNSAAFESAESWIAEAESRLAADATIVALRGYAQSLLMTGS